MAMSAPISATAQSRTASSARRAGRRCALAAAGLFGVVAGTWLIAAAAIADTPTKPPAATAAEAESAQVSNSLDTGTAEIDAKAAVDAFLDRLMMAESSGISTARNPRSTATGAYQFIEQTFIEVTRRAFHAETAALTDAELLALRTDAAFSRRVALAYSRENAAALRAAQQPTTFPALRLAFLLGPDGAIRVLTAKPETPLRELMSARVLKANPFMTQLTAAGLIARATREVAAGIVPDGFASAAIPTATKPKPPEIPSITVACDLKHDSCRNWLAIERRKYARVRVVYREGRSILHDTTQRPTTTAATSRGRRAGNAASSRAQCPPTRVSCRQFHALRRGAQTRVTAAR